LAVVHANVNLNPVMTTADLPIAIDRELIVRFC
jgi:hypothetical protein